MMVNGSGWWFFATPLKNMSSSMGRIIPFLLWKIKFMFETTNQSWVFAAVHQVWNGRNSEFPPYRNSSFPEM